MFITRIFGASRIGRPDARRRRSPSSRRFALEPLEARMALSAGPAALDPSLAEVGSPLLGIVQASVSMAKEAGISPPAVVAELDAVPGVGLVAMLEGAGINVSATTPLTAEPSPPGHSEYPIVLPDSSELIDGLAATIGVLAQQYQAGVPISDLIDGVASAVGSTPTAIGLPGISALIEVGEAEVSTAQAAGVAVPATLATSDAGWFSAAVGQIEALGNVVRSDLSNPPSTTGLSPAVSTIVGDEGGSYAIGEGSWGDLGPPEPDPDAQPVPPGLISLGKFFLRNINQIFFSYLQSSDSLSQSMSFWPEGASSDGLGPIADSMSNTGPEDPSIESAGVDGMSYATAVGRGPALTQAAFAPGEGASTSDGGPDEPVPPAPITAGEIPVDILLSDPGLSSQDGSMGLQQVVELIPVEDSSLALVATLWSLPSGPSSRPSDGDDPPGEREESVPTSASPPPWAVFVIGLDEAYERGRDACGKALRDGARQEEGVAEDGAEGRLEWRCPIIPAPEGKSRPDWAAGDRAIPSGEADSNRPVPSRSSGDEERIARLSPEHGAGDGQPPTEGAVPLAWAVPGSALIAGWFWARRRPRRGWGLVRRG
jgi:hypothetical protein